jgi:hypothetical protein
VFNDLDIDINSSGKRQKSKAVRANSMAKEKLWSMYFTNSLTPSLSLSLHWKKKNYNHYYITFK